MLFELPYACVGTDGKIVLIVFFSFSDCSLILVGGCLIFQGGLHCAVMSFTCKCYCLFHLCFGYCVPCLIRPF